MRELKREKKNEREETLSLDDIQIQREDEPFIDFLDHQIHELHKYGS